MNNDRELMQQALDALTYVGDKDIYSDTIDALRARLAQPENDFNPDWDAMAVMVEEQQRMAKRIEELEARLSQPEPAQCDGGQCGIGGYCKQCPKTQPEQKLVVKLKELLEVQGRDGTWNYDPYFHGMYNGMEVMLAVLENREPVFRGAPKKWLSKKEWQGLTDEEVKILATQGRTDFSRPVYNEFYSAIEAKLKEKNT
jgi:hypothetical protein